MVRKRCQPWLCDVMVGCREKGVGDQKVQEQMEGVSRFVGLEVRRPYLKPFTNTSQLLVPCLPLDCLLTLME